jgi:hypothetical protein
MIRSESYAEPLFVGTDRGVGKPWGYAALACSTRGAPRGDQHPAEEDHRTKTPNHETVSKLGRTRLPAFRALR